MKKPLNKTTKKIAITVDDEVLIKLEEYMNDNELYNRSNIIEKLIRNYIKTL